MPDRARTRGGVRDRCRFPRGYGGDDDDPQAGSPADDHESRPAATPAGAAPAPASCADLCRAASATAVRGSAVDDEGQSP
jgi:hypothetical protein